MTQREKDILSYFMRLVYAQLHPGWRSYPIAEMEAAYYSAGEAFANTKFSESESLHYAFYMAGSIKELQRSDHEK